MIRKIIPPLLLIALLSTLVPPLSRARESLAAQEPAPLPVKETSTLKTSLPGWKSFQIGEPVLFTIAFPSAPRTATNRHSGNDGSSSAWVFFTVDASAVFTATLTVATAGAPRSESAKWKQFNNSVAGFVDGLRRNPVFNVNKLTAEPDRRIRSTSGIEGFERRLNGERSVRVQVFNVGLRALMLAAVSVPGNEKPAQSFFDSLIIDMAQGSAEAAAAASPLAQWKRYELDAGLISVMLPGEPLTERRVSKENIPSVYYRFENDDGSYLVGHMEVVSRHGRRISAGDTPALYAIAWAQLEAEFHRSWKSQLKLSGLTWELLNLRISKPRVVQVGGLTGEEKEITSAIMDGRAQMALSNGRIFLVMGTWSIETPLAIRDAFMASTKLSSRPN